MVDVPVDGLVRQIKAAAGEAVKLLPELLPGEGLAQGVVSVQVGANGEVVQAGLCYKWVVHVASLHRKTE